MAPENIEGTFPLVLIKRSIDVLSANRRIFLCHGGKSAKDAYIKDLGCATFLTTLLNKVVALRL